MSLKKMSEVFAFSCVNYRGKAVSHFATPNDKGSVKASIAIYDGMLALAEKTGQPWRQSEIIESIPISCFEIVYGKSFLEAVEAEIATWAPDDFRRKVYTDLSAVKEVQIVGHCRQLTMGDVAAETGLDPSLFLIPTDCQDRTLAEILEVQAFENGKDIGRIAPSEADNVALMIRDVSYNGPYGRESDIAKRLHVNRYYTQALWQTFLVGQILPGGLERFTMVAPKAADERGVYDPTGWLPYIGAHRIEIGKLTADYVAANVAYSKATPDQREELANALATTKAATIVALDDWFISRLAGKLSKAPKPASKGDWAKIVTAYGADALGTTIAQAAIDGQLAGLTGRYDWLLGLSAKDIAQIRSARDIDDIVSAGLADGASLQAVELAITALDRQIDSLTVQYDKLCSILDAAKPKAKPEAEPKAKAKAEPKAKVKVTK